VTATLGVEQPDTAAAATATVTARPDLARRALMEAIGTFALVVAGCGAIVTDASRHGALGAVGVSLVFGLIIMVMIYAGDHLPGAHYNPAVTIAFTQGRHFPPREALAYIAAQCAGAALGALMLLAAWPDAPANLGATVPSVGGPRCSTSSSWRRS
jgi:glycerol uptake facilitator-like aquaporin